MITHLTPEQEALIPVYQEKWRKIALSTEPIDRQKATEAVKAAYTAIGRQEPKILFCDSPDAAYNIMHYKFSRHISSELEDEFWKELVGQLWDEHRSKLGSELDNQLWEELVEQVDNGGIEIALCEFGYCIQPEEWASACSYIDFCFSVLNLNCVHELAKWSVVQSLVNYCGRIYAYEEIAFVCDRPRILSFDNQQRLHAEGKAAISFADGFSVYAYHGVTLPEKYGKLHPNQWQAKWLLEEKNAERRRVLIQGIGYSRICQELQATQLDYWQEYTLLKIESNVDVESIYLLKMTCPSTGYIHALRVPPDINSAREAICWVNWGTDPEEFSIQT